MQSQHGLIIFSFDLRSDGNLNYKNDTVLFKHEVITIKFQINDITFTRQEKGKHVTILSDDCCKIPTNVSLTEASRQKKYFKITLQQDDFLK
jgi:hypothetical protein